MDVLTDILGSLRLTGGVVIDAETHGDWCLVSQFTNEHCAPFFPVPGNLIGYHYVRSGHMFAELNGQTVSVPAGAVVLFPRNDPHLLYSERGLEPQDASDLVQVLPSGIQKIVVPGDGPPTQIFCGFLGVSASHHPLLDALPPMLLLEHDAWTERQWLESSLRYASQELSSDAVAVARIAELFFGQAIRRYMDELPAGEGGWLAGLRDPAVAKALNVIHRRYAEELDVETLAREAGVSRTVLGERFALLIGEPPMRYCARWRMRVAANMLRDGKQNAANVAYAVGFNSEAAFTRAFKREYGEPPATWRRQFEQETKARKEAQRLGLPEQVVRYTTARDGTRLAYAVMGEGPPLVKAANWLNHLEHDWKSPVWRHWLQEFTNGHTLIRYDERANGMSDWDTPEISFEAFVDDLECVVDSAGVDTFDLLGISQGASVAIAYAVRHPERVRRLLIVGGYAAGWAARADPEEVARREAMLTLSEAGWGADNPAYRQLFTNLYIPGASAEQQQWFNEVQRVSASPENAVQLMRTFAAIDVRDLLAKVTTPTIVFHARGDQAIPFEAGECLAANIPGAVFIPLDSANHILLESDKSWHEFASATRGFLDKGVRPVRAPAICSFDKDEIRNCNAADGSRIAYAISGEGFPLVKAPNWITNLETDRSNPSYRHWIAECERSNRFIRSDMRGFGMSELEPKEFTIDSMIGDIGAVIDDLGLETCDLIGVAHGAPLAMAYAGRNPGRVRKLILVNGFAAGWRVRANPEELAWRNSLIEMNRREWSFRRSLLGEMFLTLYFPGADQELIDWHNRHLPEFGPVTRLEAMIELAADIDVREDLSNIRAETLICHSKQDGNAPLYAGKEVADAIPGSRFVELDGANHILLANEPAWPAFVHEMRAFLGAGRKEPVLADAGAAER
jgi:pimeloyl-ACP methyl ester carboxylesterase/AraC-like DNA-binding protein